MIRIPVIGQVSAGSPSEWIPIDKWRWIRPLKSAVPGERLYGMEVIGDSLIEKHIQSGDVLVFIYGRKSMPGDLCIVQTPHGITAKFIFPREEGEILLRSANKMIKDQVWSASDIKILGVVKRSERDL